MEQVQTSDTPDQQEIDQIASFVEAARELRKEPFFHADEKRSTTVQGENFTFEVGDRFHFRSALVTFRRIWMKGESSYFFSCQNILRKYPPTAKSPLLEEWRSNVSKVLKQPAFIGMPGARHETLTSDDLIDLWMNGVFAHVSVDNGRDKRHKFEEFQEKYGQGVMEFAFRNAVWQLGLSYFNTHDHGASQFLDYCEKELLLRPSFKIGAPFGEKNREVTSQGQILIRKSSSRFYNEETTEQMLERILSRQQFRSLKSLFDNLANSTARNAKAIIWSDSIEEVIQKSFMLMQIEEIDLSEPLKNRSVSRSYSTLFDLNTKEKSMMICDESRIITDSIGLRILNRDMSNLKIAIKDALREI